MRSLHSRSAEEFGAVISRNRNAMRSERGVRWLGANRRNLYTLFMTQSASLIIHFLLVTNAVFCWCCENRVHRVHQNYASQSVALEFCVTGVISTVPSVRRGSRRTLRCGGLFFTLFYLFIYFYSPDRKKSLTFPYEIADNISNKCTFINMKYACYNNDWVAFQQMTTVNSKCWTSAMQNELKYE